MLSAILVRVPLTFYYWITHVFNQCHVDNTKFFCRFETVWPLGPQTVAVLLCSWVWENTFLSGFVQAGHSGVFVSWGIFISNKFKYLRLEPLVGKVWLSEQLSYILVKSVRFLFNCFNIFNNCSFFVNIHPVCNFNQVNLLSFPNCTLFISFLAFSLYSWLRAVNSNRATT